MKPAILRCAIDHVRARLADLREVGVVNPVKMITSNPTILRYSIENIRSKIATLGELGFADPVKMVTSSPPILRLPLTTSAAGWATCASSVLWIR